MRGLSHAHSRGIIHRDIKPQNIMVLRYGSVKVADFGIACLANASQTLTQEALGSVHYISPEQARGDRIDARSDIYSAGVVLYEMLTGRLPFEGDSAVSVAIQHLSSVPLAPRDIDPDIPEPLELICMKAMNSDPDKRYPTADAMLEDLEKFRKDPTVDMDYIRKELTAVQPDSEPTMPLPTAQVATAVKKRTEQVRRDEPEEDVRFRDKKSIAIMAGIFAAALIVLVIVVDFAALAKACQVLPTGTVYAVFAAVGTIGAAVLDVALFERTLSVGQGLFMGVLVLGVVALKLADEPESGDAA